MSKHDALDLEWVFTPADAEAGEVIVARIPTPRKVYLFTGEQLHWYPEHRDSEALVSLYTG